MGYDPHVGREIISQGRKMVVEKNIKQNIQDNIKYLEWGIVFILNSLYLCDNLFYGVANYDVKKTSNYTTHLPNLMGLELGCWLQKERTTTVVCRCLLLVHQLIILLGSNSKGLRSAVLVYAMLN